MEQSDLEEPAAGCTEDLPYSFQVQKPLGEENQLHIKSY